MAALLLLVVLSALVQSPAPASPPAGLVVGQVVDAATNRPIPRAIVSFDAAHRVLADDQGRFLFRDLPKGAYLFAASAPGYLDGGYGRRRPNHPTQPFSLGEDQRVGGATIQLWKEATLGGSVTDETDAPVVDVSVSLVRRETGSGPGQPADPLPYSVRTNDRGAYQFVGLLPGDYLVSVATRMTAMPAGLIGADTPAVVESLRASGSTAMSTGMNGMSPAVRVGDFIVQTSGQGNWGGSNALFGRLPGVVLPDGRIRAVPTTFYPSVTAAPEATVVSLESGDDRTGIDLQLRPVTMGRVSGTLVGPAGPLPNFAVHLIPSYAANDMLERTHETAVTASDASGAFVFPAIPPGSYVLKAWNLPQALVIGSNALGPDMTLWAEIPLTVGDTPTPGVTVTLRPGSTISGRVEFTGSAPTLPAPSVQTLLSVCFEPAWTLAFGARLGTRVSADGSFITQGLPPGKYFPKLPNQFLTRGWFLESVTFEGRDLMTVPLTLDARNISGVLIKFTDRGTDLSGRVDDVNGKPAPAATVLVFPADYRQWIDNGMFALSARALPVSSAGMYSVTGLKPGDYFVSATKDDRPGVWRQAAAIEAMVPRANRVTLLPGRPARQDLTVR